MDCRTPMIFKTLLVALVSVTLGFLTPVHAQQADPGAAALTEMLKALGSPSGGAGSSEVDQQVRALTGSPSSLKRSTTWRRRSWPSWSRARAVT